MKTFGERVSEVMEERGIKQADLHAETGLSRMTISKIVRSITLNPSVDVALALAQQLDVDLEWLISGKHAEHRYHGAPVVLVHSLLKDYSRLEYYETSQPAITYVLDMQGKRLCGNDKAQEFEESIQLDFRNLTDLFKDQYYDSITNAIEKCRQGNVASIISPINDQVMNVTLTPVFAGSLISCLAMTMAIEKQVSSDDLLDSIKNMSPEDRIKIAKLLKEITKLH